jgi:hypothetical protein
MNHGHPRIRPPDIRAAALVVLVGLIALAPTMTGSHAAASGNLSVISSTNVLVAATNSTLLLEITNVGDYLKELDVALTIPSPLVLFGDNHWIRSSFAYGDTIRANLTVFAPSSAAGSTVQGSVAAVYKVIGETTQSTETHAISFLIRGWIDIKVYEVTVDPDPALPGSEITISGNLLNRGVVPAMYANVTLAASPPLVEDSVQSMYVGEVDPNAPAPFSVTVLVDSGATAGMHQTSILVHYRDDLEVDHTMAVPVSFTVVSELPKTETAGPSVMNLLSPTALLTVVIAVLVLAAIVIYIRRRRRQVASET